MKTISLNGTTRDTSSETITDLVNELALAPQTLLIEHNGTALHRSEWPDTALRDGDRVEMLRVAAGG
ncbi:MAG: sulfur carrier protein ThiS [Terrimicrobiaceae bacterium]